MEDLNHNLSLSDLALQYGTINKEQHALINKLFALKNKEGFQPDFGKLLTQQKFATQYQVGLLKLIQDYMIIKKQGEEFGRIAVEKGLATKEDIDRALAYQKKEFKRAKIKKLIGDILVESRVITVKQRDLILKEQTFVDEQAKKILSEETDRTDQNDVNLTVYEQQFLKIKALDHEFAASAVEKGFATEKETEIAQKKQEKEFEKENKIRFLGDIMIELGFLTPEQNQSLLKEQHRSDEKTKKYSDQKFSLEISSDRTEAFVAIRKKSEEITIGEIKKALSAEKIKNGVYPDSLIQCHLDFKNEKFLVAKQNLSLSIFKNGNVTYFFETDKISTVLKKKGETLAEYKNASERIMKKDIYGSHADFPEHDSPFFRCSTGTRISKDQAKVFAGKTGFPSLSFEQKLYIHPAISVLEDADLKYGQLEEFANLNISGVLTGAYSINAGNIIANEIRGADINSVGDIITKIGITDSTIFCQGEISATYVHNSRIYTFGNIYVENEIIDSEIYVSGKIFCKNCTAITSSLFGREGVEISIAGSKKTQPCQIGVGTEHQVVKRVNQLNSKISAISTQLDELKENRRENEKFSKKTFQKMVELKIFHDRAKEKEEKLTVEFKTKKDALDKSKLKNIAILISNFKKRKKSSIDALKELNKTKKRYDLETNKIQSKINRTEPGVTRNILELKKDITAYLEWARNQKKSSGEIIINKKIFAGTILKGAFSSLTVLDDKKSLRAEEKKNSSGFFEIKIGQI